MALRAQAICPTSAGATVIASTAQKKSKMRTAYNISMTIEGKLRSTGVVGIRADFYNSATDTYPQKYSYFFYPANGAKVSDLVLLLISWQINYHAPILSQIL